MKKEHIITTLPNLNIDTNSDLFYLPMGRMSDYKKEFDLACEKIVKLEQENKKLQEKVNTYSEEYGNLREENRKLREKLNKAGLEEYGFFNE